MAHFRRQLDHQALHENSPACHQPKKDASQPGQLPECPRPQAKSLFELPAHVRPRLIVERWFILPPQTSTVLHSSLSPPHPLGHTSDA